MKELNFKSYYETPGTLALWERYKLRVREERARRNTLVQKDSLTKVNESKPALVKAEEQPVGESVPLPKNPTPADIINSLLKFGEDGKCINAFKVVSSVQVLRLAYESIKSKPGNMVRGVNSETLDGISVE